MDVHPTKNGSIGIDPYPYNMSWYPLAKWRCWMAKHNKTLLFWAEKPLTLELYPHFIPGPKPQGAADGAHAVLLVSKDTQAMIQRSMRYCGWKKGSGIAWGITFFPLRDSFLDFPFCPFFLAICSMLELEAAISTVFATFSYFPWYLHHFGAPSVHVAWYFATKVKGWFGGLFGAGLASGCFYSCFMGFI